MISIKDLSYAYKTAQGNSKALDKINLEIHKGEWLAIIGPNGSGKSTLARHLNALLLPDEGSIAVEGMDTRISEMIWKIRQKVAFVFQNPDNQLIATTVEEDVAFGPENLGFPPDKIEERVSFALQAVGMEEHRAAAPHLLSGGQKQRVAIAGALAMNPDYLVMDEATSMLDPRGRKEVIETLRKLNQDIGLTIIYITHFMEEVVYAHRAVVIEKGQITHMGTPQEIFSLGDLLSESGLDVPEIMILAAKLKQRGWLSSGEILTLDEMVAELCQLK
ncbi:energy-coupling factor transporter ATPase [Dehalobacterium formicoaceticum]|uniref:Energy-coupling factor transporter ATPase n=1 Tax=Dehalobacterium formicoaceticum TaxID=51515 RepID=A0ABT1Y1B6_9FIRM|nr:energy-coupling factor transporter ATPase [Dehalobacterium formicoaceticum]MCR6543985.1 energy-coupling factor transporter ATPase [Dehalobacterium formicoaceticum]